MAGMDTEVRAGAQGTWLSLTCHYSRSMWEHRREISSASQDLPHLSLLSWAHPPQAGLDQAGEAELGSMSEDLCPGVQVQGISIRWGAQTVGKRSNFHLEGCRVLTGPLSCLHPIHECAPEAGGGSDCGPGDSPGSWHPSSGSSACSGPAKDRGKHEAQMKVFATRNRQFRDN